jgi:hypothetical protein
MNITTRTGKILVSHNGKSMQLTYDELLAMRTMDDAALGCYLRSLYPSRNENDRLALDEIRKTCLH